MIHLNIGSNLSSLFGSRYDNIAIAINLLIESKLKISKISNFYETPSYPNRKLPKFLNIGILANYNQSHFDLLRLIRLIEKKIGRKKATKNESRVIDIDIIDFNGKVYNLEKNNRKLLIPHKSMHLRNFVLFPLFEISKKWSHPILKRNITDLIFSLPIDKLRTIKLI